MPTICVFCGSRSGRGDDYIESARTVGKLLAEKSIGLVYGGASIGMMAAVADSVLDNGGEVTGVLPHFLVEKEIAHVKVTELKIVQTMHKRKMLMNELADAFLTLPGGLGTLDELFEALTWAQIGLHQKPCAILNVNGYYDPLLQFLDRIRDERFVSASSSEALLIDSDPEVLIDKLLEHIAQ